MSAENDREQKVIEAGDGDVSGSNPDIAPYTKILILNQAAPVYEQGGFFLGTVDGD